MSCKLSYSDLIFFALEDLGFGPFPLWLKSLDKSNSSFWSLIIHFVCLSYNAFSSTVKYYAEIFRELIRTKKICTNTDNKINTHTHLFTDDKVYKNARNRSINEVYSHWGQLREIWSRLFFDQQLKIALMGKGRTASSDVKEESSKSGGMGVNEFNESWPWYLSFWNRIYRSVKGDKNTI